MDRRRGRIFIPVPLPLFARERNGFTVAVWGFRKNRLGRASEVGAQLWWRGFTHQRALRFPFHGAAQLDEETRLARLQNGDKFTVTIEDAVRTMRGDTSAGPCGGGNEGRTCPAGLDTTSNVWVQTRSSSNTPVDHAFYIAILG